MKKNLATTIAVLSVLFTSCVKEPYPDGQPGDVYISIDSPLLYCMYFTSINAGGTPVGAVTNTSYLATPGTYSYNYTVSSTCGYIDYAVDGSYTMTADPGGAGTTESYGADGEDRYYHLQCEFSGATLDY